jgi:hypothetical protein
MAPVPALNKDRPRAASTLELSLDRCPPRRRLRMKALVSVALNASYAHGPARLQGQLSEAVSVRIAGACSGRLPAVDRRCALDSVAGVLDSDAARERQLGRAQHHADYSACDGRTRQPRHDMHHARGTLPESTAALSRGAPGTTRRAADVLRTGQAAASISRRASSVRRV